MRKQNRRQFIRDLGLAAATVPLVMGLPSLGFANAPGRKQRLVICFSPNGIVPDNFWPDEQGECFMLKRILAPLEPYQNKLLALRGLANRVRGDGDGHMRGMSCLLTGIELFPGNIQGGSDTPAGWASGISIDQEIKNYLQSQTDTRTRFGSIELGVGVPHRADPWTRMVYAGPNKPIAPIDNPYQTFEKLYGRLKDTDNLKSILDDVGEDLRKVSTKVSTEDKRLLDEHLTFVREMEQDLQESEAQKLGHAVPPLDPGVANNNDNLPALSKMQLDLLVNSFVNDMARVATVQYTNSVGGAKMRWLGIEEGHHALSHDPDFYDDSKKKHESHEKLIKINTWFCEQLAYLVRRLAETPEPNGHGSLLDNTLVIWTNELGKGNSHSLEDIPFILVGGAPGFRMSRSIRYKKQLAHNRLWLSVARSFGHEISTFGNPRLCEGGALDLS